MYIVHNLLSLFMQFTMAIFWEYYDNSMSMSSRSVNIVLRLGFAMIGLLPVASADYFVM